MSRSIDLDFIILWNFKYIYKTKQKQQSDKRSWKTVSIVVCVCVCCDNCSVAQTFSPAVSLSCNNRNANKHCTALHHTHQTN